MAIIDTRPLERISKDINLAISDELDNLNLFFRVFYRFKSTDSLEKKLRKKNKDGSDKYTTTKKVQDVIGLRINLYFADDVDVVYQLFKKKFEFVDETIDKNLATEFKPTRINLIFKIPKEQRKEFKDLTKDIRIDDTFELQLRTVLSEGWHEVDHDLRYKCEADWARHADLSRMFNGILAALETKEWSILQLFDKLSYRHYKNGDCEAMLRTKFRIRLEGQGINNVLKKIINEPEIRKRIFRIERMEFLDFMKDARLIIPMTLENLVYILNANFIHEARITEITPAIIQKELGLIGQKAPL